MSHSSAEALFSHLCITWDDGYLQFCGLTRCCAVSTTWRDAVRRGAHSEWLQRHILFFPVALAPVCCSTLAPPLLLTLTLPVCPSLENTQGPAPPTTPQAWKAQMCSPCRTRGGRRCADGADARGGGSTAPC